MITTQDPVGPADLALSPLPRVHYADLFSMSPAVDAGPEQWARAMFGDVPSPGEVFIWRVILGLRLRHGPSPDTVAGWRIAERGPDLIRLETESWFLAANLIVRVTDGRVSLLTLLHYRRAFGHAVWPVCAVVHRRLIPTVFADAVTRQSRRALHSRGENP